MSAKVAKTIKITNMLEEVKIQSKEGFESFIRGLPMCLLIPLYLFMMNPTTENGVFATGAMISLIIGIFSIPGEKIDSANSAANSAANSTKLPNAFLGNTISAYGLAIGFMGGYKMLDGVFNSKLGNILSSFLVTLIVGVIVSWGLHIDDANKVPAEIANTFLAISVGAAIGGYSAWVVHYLQKQKLKKEEKSKVLCTAYKDGSVINIGQPE